MSIELQRTVESIQVGARHRADLGDIQALADSIREHGLLQPITVTIDGGMPARIGLATAERLAKAGWNVAILARDAKRLGEARARDAERVARAEAALERYGDRAGNLRALARFVIHRQT